MARRSDLPRTRSAASPMLKVGDLICLVALVSCVKVGPGNGVFSAPSFRKAKFCKTPFVEGVHVLNYAMNIQGVRRCQIRNFVLGISGSVHGNSVLATRAKRNIP